jgi:type IV secretory pathway protease TraF
MKIMHHKIIGIDWRSEWKGRVLVPVILSGIMALSVLLFTSKFTLGIELGYIRCLPYTLYVLEKNNNGFQRGDYIVFYSDKLEPMISKKTRLLKIAAGVPGDKVSVTPKGVTITTPSGESRHWGIVHRDMLFRVKEHRQEYSTTLDDFYREFVLGTDEFCALGTTTRSFDCRYWGAEKTSTVAGRAWPVF